MHLPIAGLGLVYSLVAALVARASYDAMMGWLALAGGAVTILRSLHLLAYSRARANIEYASLRRWELQYGIGVAAFALLVALLNVLAFVSSAPVVQLLSLSIYFSFGAGLVSRISIRPRICSTGIIIATLPTVAAIIVSRRLAGSPSLYAELYLLLAILIGTIAVMSLQTLSHLYKKAVIHHVHEHDMANLAKRDSLTGLANRLLLREHFHGANRAKKDRSLPFALHYIDLDGFKPVNDTYGHLAGDALLTEVARRLESTVRSSDTVARLGGDEFVVLQVDVTNKSDAEILASRIVKRLSVPYALGQNVITISASVGVAIRSSLIADFDLLLSCADKALYQAKAAGKSRVSFFTESEAFDLLMAA
ncbi:GGDEF domain-containing protein [Novosphingobium sp. TW-4]|uniref:GGDEF domain-containing protein n=2 Tax=Novosphingobium olei TaxID=2728851 RepID=A0A7Y0G8A7_9SPHN|nr:GGDEF domain-containing protein [Novosphingobium olei]